MNRKWWSVLIPALALLWPTEARASAVVDTKWGPKDENLLKRKIDYRYFFSFNRIERGGPIVQIRHSSHSSHSSHVSHSSHTSHVSGSGLPSYADPAPTYTDPVPRTEAAPGERALPAVIGQILFDVKLRETPSSGGTVLLVVRKGQLVEITETSSSWTKISFVQGAKTYSG